MEIQPLRALHYDLRAVDGLDKVISPPYDVIDEEQRAELAAKSPFNAVEIDLPRIGGEAPIGLMEPGDPYLHAQTILQEWVQQGIVIRDRDPAIWPMTQEFTTRPGDTVTRHGFFCRVRVSDYGAGRIRPHERTHPGPKEDRLRLTRATRANLSPIFSLYEDPEGAAWTVLADAIGAAGPWGEAEDTACGPSRLWRVTDPDAIAAVEAALEPTELLIADGHHRYETARVYAEEVGGEGDHRYVLMYLVALDDPGLAVFPTHRLLTNLKDSEIQERLGSELKRMFDIREIEPDELEPAADEPGPAFGYIDAHFQRAFRLTLKDQELADQAMPDHAEPYRRLEPAVLEALVLNGVLNMTEEDIAHLNGLAYSKSFDDALEAVRGGRADAAFFLRATPVEQVREVAAAGESMPPKSTFFHPKVPTGMVFNPLS
jgi:uncharacterized protein (DUF1015 family)